MGIQSMGTLIMNNIKITFNVKGTFRNAETGEITKTFKGKNLVVNTGLNSFAARCAGMDIPANKKATITYCAIGLDGTAVDPTDTTLGSELFRKQISNRDYSSATSSFRTFFNTSEANGTLLEIGLFGDDATVTADSGTMFCRLVINKEKTTSETLTLDWDVTFAAS
jgi:hypothetical protein